MRACLSAGSVARKTSSQRLYAFNSSHKESGEATPRSMTANTAELIQGSAMPDLR